MLNKIADLVEFDRERFSEAQIIEDFNHKFHRSILKIDGEYRTVSLLQSRARGLTLDVFNEKGDELGIKYLKTIEKVLPATGLYSSDKGLLYLYRIPRRQWVKSLSLNQNYKVQMIERGPMGEVPSIYDTVLVDNPRYAKESLIHNNNVYLHWKRVGKVKNGALVVTNKNFLEEIKELWNTQYQTITEADLPPQKVEKLILDF
jgi:hypothetical protein